MLALAVDPAGTAPGGDTAATPGRTAPSHRADAPGPAATAPAARWLRVEGAVALAAAVAAYGFLDASWWLFAALFLVPDVGMLGYLAGPRAAALAYNLAHTTVLPALLAGLALTFGWTAVLPVAAIWVAHIGFDRMLGYGLKLPSGFHDTHLGRTGRRVGAR